jgi:hypothetical protein
MRVLATTACLRFCAVLGLSLCALCGCMPPAARPITVWAVSEDEELWPDTAPMPENEVFSASVQQLRLTAALNETVAFQVGLRGSAGTTGALTVEFTDLDGPSESLPAGVVFRPYRVHTVSVRRFPSWYPDHTGRPATPTEVPDILVPWNATRGGGPAPVAESKNELVWVDVRVPATTTPGEYRGRAVWRDAVRGAPVAAWELRLEVLPVALPDRRSLPVVCRVDPRPLLAAHLRWPPAPAEQTRLLPDVPSHYSAVELVNATMRLFQEHRTNPILWASFPKYRPAGERRVEIEWDAYDALVSGWLDGTAFPDRTRLEIWPLPASIEYPSAALNGGVTSPQYAQLLSAYLRACEQHFADRGWLGRSVLRLCGPAPLTVAAADRWQHLSQTVRRSEVAVPIIAHLAARSLRGLGWFEAPLTEGLEADIWAPPAMWFEPGAMAEHRARGQQTWIIPDAPPYSGSLALGASPNDARVLAWQAYALGIQGLWVEHAAEPYDGLNALEGDGVRDAGLIYPAQDYGLPEAGPVASLRLKRLRRGLQDYELLRLLEANGKRLLAERMAGQMVRWAGTDACLEHLLSTKEAGWPAAPTVFRLARLLMLRELAGEFAPGPGARQRQIASLSQWSLLFNQAERVTVGVDGVRVIPAGQGLRARVMTRISNAAGRTIEGRWHMPAPPPQWTPAGAVPVQVPAGGHRSVPFEIDVGSLTYNTDGVYPFALVFESTALGTFQRDARLAVAACPLLETPPVIDGRLDDWPLATHNAAGDFQLCRRRLPTESRPALPTQAFFGLDAQNLYIGVRCTLRPGEPPVWTADNEVPVDGVIPWGQDVVEVLMDPRPTTEGTSSDLYCLQIKPSGLLVARKGCRTEPPMGSSQVWQSGARVSVSLDPDAWVLELAVPVDSFGPQARRNPYWGLNVTRLDARRGEYSSWSGARGHCYAPSALGNLIMLWP